MNELTPDVLDLAALRQRLAGGDLLLVEVLPERSYDAGHLPGALRADLGSLAEQAATLLPDKDAPVVLYCSDAACGNSAVAARTLAGLGHTAVSIFEGGKAAWVQAGLRLVSGD